MSELPDSQLFESDVSDVIRRLDNLASNQVKAADVEWAHDVLRGRRSVGVRVHPWLVFATAVMKNEIPEPEGVQRVMWLDGVYRHQFHRTFPGIY